MTTKENMKRQDDIVKQNAEGQRFIPHRLCRKEFSRRYIISFNSNSVTCKFRGYFMAKSSSDSLIGAGSFSPFSGFIFSATAFLTCSLMLLCLLHCLSRSKRLLRSVGLLWSHRPVEHLLRSYSGL